MGLTKQYLRYCPGGVFGLVGSQNSNVIYLDVGGFTNRYCAVGACENVIIWDLRTGQKHAVLAGDKHEVTCVAKSPCEDSMAVGYADGMINVFHLTKKECTIHFSGHKSAVTALSYDHQGMKLVSGAKDTDVIVWDIVNESGLYRLKGHKGAITQAAFLKTSTVLVTSSKDSLVKFWDLDTQHCFKTLVGHRSEVYDFVILNDEEIVTGCADSQLRVWKITHLDEETGNGMSKKSKLTASDDEDEEQQEELQILSCKKLGFITRASRDRVVALGMDPGGRLLACLGRDSTIELFEIATEEELEKRLAKRRKKQRRKQTRAEMEGKDGISQLTAELTIADKYHKLQSIKVALKGHAFDLRIDENGFAKVLSLSSNNSLEVYTLEISLRNPELSSPMKLHLPAHRTDVRTVCFSSENMAVLSGSGDSVKIWNRSSMQCIRTLTCQYALCSLFAPGDRLVIIGTKSGLLQLFDISSGSLVKSIEAHTGSVWSLHMYPDKNGIASGSSDKTVKFWNFEMVEEEKDKPRHLTLDHKRTLQLDEEVLSVKYSPNHNFLALALLDSTVKVFFADTLKFFLSLYGHKLPALCIDISYDSTILVSGSADRNIKLWGLDFGDCHKSLFAHDDSVTCVQFVPNTHLFFSAGKDKKIKQWDADNFSLIITLEGHQSEIWGLAVSPSGNFVVSASHDKSLRLWEKTQELLVLQDEREMEREREYDKMMEGSEPVIPGETTTEVGMAGKVSVETVKAAEKLMEAIEVYREETARMEAAKDKPLTSNPLLAAYGVDTPEKYVLEVLRRIRSRVHHGQITSNAVLKPVIEDLKGITLQKVRKLRDTIGFNLAGMKFLQRKVEEKEEVAFFADATKKVQRKKKKTFTLKV